MHTVPSKQKQFDQLVAHITTLQDEMVRKQSWLIMQENIPAAEIVRTHKVLQEMGVATVWLQNVAKTQYKEFIPVNGEDSASKIIAP